MSGVIKLNRSESKITKFVQRAASKDIARPILNGVNINEQSISAADGFRLHAVQADAVPALAEVKGQTVNLGKIRNAALNYVKPEEIPGHFPDTSQLIPAGELSIRFAVDPRFLVDACKTLDKGSPVCITVYADTSPVEIQGVIDEQPVYALLMPMHLEGHGCPDLTWKPSKGKVQKV